MRASSLRPSVDLVTLDAVPRQPKLLSDSDSDSAAQHKALQSSQFCRRARLIQLYRRINLSRLAAASMCHHVPISKSQAHSTRKKREVEESQE